jgi:hypothetical protein
VLPLEHRPGVGKSSPLLLKLPLSPLPGGTLLQEPVLRDGERCNLGVEGGPQLVGLLGPLLGRARSLLCLALLGLRAPEQRVELQVVAADGGHLRLPVGRQGAHPLQVSPRLLQCLIPLDEGCTNPLESGGARRGLPFALLKLVAQGLHPVRQPTVRRPQGLRERDEGVTLLLEMAELGAHLVEGAILVTGAMLELLPPTNQTR